MKVNLQQPIAITPGTNLSFVVRGAAEDAFRNGNPALKVELAAPGGQVLVERFCLEGPGTAFLAPFLEACDIDVASGSVDITPTMVVGKTVVADIVEESFNGRKQLRLRNFRKATAR